MTTNPPTWDERNLRNHHAKRIRENPGCFEDLLGIVGRPVMVEEYERRSVQAFENSWIEYEAESRDFRSNSYRNTAVHYADEDLVVAITDEARLRFVTCFHEHFDSRQGLHGKNPGRAVSVAQRRIRYLEDLRIKEKGRLIINLRMIRDGQPQK